MAEQKESVFDLSPAPRREREKEQRKSIPLRLSEKTKIPPKTETFVFV